MSSRTFSCVLVKSVIFIAMDKVKYQKNYRKDKLKRGWKYFSVLVPNDCYVELKKCHLLWKIENLKR